MGKLRSDFEKKYGFDGVDFVKQAGNEYFGAVKSIGVQSVLKNYAEKKGYDVEINDEFLSRLIEALAEAGEKFPENQKVKIDYFQELQISPIDPSVPKSKGTLQDFKNIVASDDLRLVMQGVFVSDDGYLVGTDAHKLVKYKTIEFLKDKGKIINLKIYLGTKGDKINFIDEKYPNYEAVIPRNNEFKVENLNTYAFYNLCKSAIALKKLQDSDIFNIHFKEKGLEFALNPILFAELLEFALAKGFDKFDLEFSAPNRAFLLKFKDGSEGLIMPILGVDNKGTKVYTFDQVESEFSGGGKTKTKGKALPKSTSKEPKKDVPYKKFEGDLSDVTYIPRRDISLIVLKNGEELSSADIIDGVYKLNSKKKFAKGGSVKKGLTVAKKYTKLAVKKAKPVVKKGVKVTKKYGKIAIKKSKPIVKKGLEKAKIGFDALAKKVAKSYEGSAVQKKYQSLYGKFYSKKEAEEVGNKVASKVYRQQQGMK
jgi:hypothetical protein